MKTQCPHCNQEYDVDDQNNGEIVTCEACKQEFVIEPMPEGEDNTPPEAVPEVHRKAEPVPAPEPVVEAVPEAAANPNMMYCRNCGKQIAREAVMCPGCGTQYGPVGEDKLNGGIILLLWLLLLVPFVGGILVILVSSILYYAWKGSYPKKAKAVNLHGWLVFLVSILLWMILFRLR